MTETARAQDRALLASCMLRLRQGGASTTPLAQRRQGVQAILHALPRAGAGRGPGIDELLAAPSMAIFKALTQGAKAVEAACMAHPASLVDTPLNEAAIAAGLPGGKDEPRRATVLHFTALQLCAHADLWREARALLAHGANPNKFNAQVTAIGLAAYTGSARSLCEMISFGANATLHLAPEHAPGAPSAHGSTLLHRVANRPIGDNKKAVVLILAHCAASYPDPLPKALDGTTPMDWADDDETREALLSAVADRAAAALRPATPPRRKANTRLRM